MNPFAKSIDSELERLDALLSRQEGVVRQAFARFVAEAKDERLVAQAADLLQRGDIEGALNLVDSYITRLGAVIPQVYQEAAKAELPTVTAQLGLIAPTVAVSFDPTDTRAAMWMRAASLEFIRRFTEQQRAATRQALTAGLETGAGTQAMARAFRDSIGLTPYQERVVRNYGQLLRDGSAEALQRQLRDRRFDATVARAAAGGAPLTEEQVTRMVDRYRQRFLAYRAETIARTETGEIVSVAREEALRQNLALANIPDRNVEQAWRTTVDGRERETHHEMNGQLRPLGVPFDSPSGAQLRWPCDRLAPADEVINCRCHRTFRIDTAAVVLAA